MRGFRKTWTTDRSQKAKGLFDSFRFGRRSRALIKCVERCIVIEALESRQLLSATFTVNSAGDDPTGPTSGIVTLRDAINSVNNDSSDSAASPDQIHFNMGSSATIMLGADLPTLHRPALIDGSTQTGVTIDGQASAGANNSEGYAVLVVDSAATVKNVTFTDGTLTVDAAGSLTVSGDLNLGDAAGDATIVQNQGSVTVNGNVVGADSVGVNGYSGATFKVTGQFTAGQYGFVYETGAAGFNVAGNVTLGESGFIYNGQGPTDQAALSIGGTLFIGPSGFIYNYGLSSFNVTGNVSIGNGGFLYNGADSSSTDNANFVVDGSFSIGAGGYIDNDGTSTITVVQSLTLGAGGSVNNGQFASDAAKMHIGGSFSISSGPCGVTNEGHSVLQVTGDFSLGNDASLNNGAAGSDAAQMTVGGSFSLGTGSALDNQGSSVLSVAKNFSMGAGSYFVDGGTMSVSGAFDPGSASTSSSDVIAGTFNARPGSSITTDSAVWNVQAGGKLNVAAGASFTVASGGTLAVAGTMTDSGIVTVPGSLTSAALSSLVVDEAGQLNTHSATQFKVQGTLLQWANPASISQGTALGSTQLDASATTMVGGSFVAVPGTFVYTLANGATAASGAVLGVGQGQVLNVTFVPSDSSQYAGASAQALVNVVQGIVTPTITVNPINITYGTALSNGQLNGTGTALVNNQVVTVAGTFTFSTAAGALLNSGNGQTEAVTFTPGNASAYAVATGTVVVNVARANQTITISRPAPSSAAQGSSFTVTATCSCGMPVSIVAGGACTVSSGGSGSATLQMTAGTGTATVTFSQPGNSNFNPATAVTETVTATPVDPLPVVPVSVQLASSASPAVFGQSVTFTATVTGASGGAVQFVVDGANLGTPVMLNANGSATSTATAFQTGANHSIEAVFTGSSSTASGTATLAQMVSTAAVEADPSNPALTDLFIGNSQSTHLVSTTQLSPVGSSKTGATGVELTDNLSGTLTQITYTQAFNKVYIFASATRNNIEFASSLTLSANVSGAGGDDIVRLGQGNNVVTLGAGHDIVQAGNGNNTITLGNGNDGVLLGNGSNSVNVGTGNNLVQVGNGNNVIVGGGGRIGVVAGNGDNLIVGGLSQSVILAGNGSNILIDGSVQLANPGDSLPQVLADWMQHGASDAASISARLKMTFNTTAKNVIRAGTGLDWFWFTNQKDQVKLKPTDLLNAAATQPPLKSPHSLKH